jgi:PAS domain S-box-containing protein
MGLLALGGLLVAVTLALLFGQDQRHFRVLSVALIGGLWIAVALVVQHLMRQLREAAGSVHRFAQSLRRDDLTSAIDALRSDSTHGASVLDDVAGEVERVLGERERRWKARVRLSGDWYWETDAQMRINWVSEDMASHLKLGLKPEELLGRTHDDVPFYMPPPEGWAHFNERLSLRKSFRDVEIEVRRPGRSPLWMALSGRARRDEDGRFIGYEGVGRDITEQRLAFKRLADSERRYAVMAELSADWYWETDTEHRLTLTGPMLRDLLGDTGLQRFEGRTRWQAFPDGADDEAWQRHSADLYARRDFRGFEYIARVPGRGARWFSINGRPRYDDKGQFIGYHGVGRDITLRKRAEKMLLTRNAQLERLVAERTAKLEQSNRDLEAFSRQLAHELRTPIGHVVGLSDLLRARAWERLAEDERGWLTLQGQSARAMSHTVTALLELARSGSVALVLEAVDLTALAQAVAGEVPWLERGAPVDWQLEPGLMAVCSAPLARVVLMNLFANAAKFTRDTAQPAVRFGRDTASGMFFVQDNGAGFDPQRSSSLFQPFVRLHGSAEFQGTGLGLSIVRRIVERHGGSVRAQGRPGEGARFDFSFTTAPLSSAEDGENTDDGVRPAA